jgi:hypothetical protein
LPLTQEYLEACIDAAVAGLRATAPVTTTL